MSKNLTLATIIDGKETVIGKCHPGQARILCKKGLATFVKGKVLLIDKSDEKADFKVESFSKKLDMNSITKNILESYIEEGLDLFITKYQKNIQYTDILTLQKTPFHKELNTLVLQEDSKNKVKADTDELSDIPTIDLSNLDQIGLSDLSLLWGRSTCVSTKTNSIETSSIEDVNVNMLSVSDITDVLWKTKEPVIDLDFEFISESIKIPSSLSESELDLLKNRKPFESGKR